MFLFNKRVLRYFRKDGHSWRKKKDGRTVGEAHERLKVGNAEALNCYYAHGEKNPNFQRRSYWMLDLGGRLQHSCHSHLQFPLLSLSVPAYILLNIQASPLLVVPLINNTRMNLTLDVGKFVLMQSSIVMG